MAEQVFVSESEEGDVISCSCPGKVLLAGGYLVLERPYQALTIATTARFVTSIRDRRGKSTAADLIRPYALVLEVDSPQFREQYVYVFDTLSGTLDSVGSDTNSFVHKCIHLTLLFLLEHTKAQFSHTAQQLESAHATLSLCLQADNDFYSQTQLLRSTGQPLRSSSLLNLPRFKPCPQDAHGKAMIAKTGLGSSACMVASLVASLLTRFRLLNLVKDPAAAAGTSCDSEGLRLVHRLAQLVHALAQGKVGSGFDVSAAVYGKPP
ncbi:hypothetical protein EON64_19160, partial [archaeon]